MRHASTQASVVSSTVPRTPRCAIPRRIHKWNATVGTHIAMMIGSGKEERNPITYSEMPASVYQNILGTYLSVMSPCDEKPMPDPERHRTAGFSEGCDVPSIETETAYNPNISINRRRTMRTVHEGHELRAFPDQHPRETGRGR